MDAITRRTDGDSACTDTQSGTMTDSAPLLDVVFQGRAEMGKDR